jgi:hypothetical protein
MACCSSSWIPTAAVVSALVGVGAYSMFRGDCDSCLLGSLLNHEPAAVETVAATTTDSCCSQSASKAQLILAANADAEPTCADEGGCEMVMTVDGIIVEDSTDCDNQCDTECDDASECDAHTTQTATTEEAGADDAG